MNILLLPEGTPNGPVTVTGDQHTHIQKVLKLTEGSALRVGAVNGLVGTGTVTRVEPGATHMDVSLTCTGSPPLPLTVILALPRPQMIKRILQTVATLGVQELHLIQTSKVEKSFWQSPSVTEESITEHLLLGLEQGVATHLPIIHKHQRFRPFAEDVLPRIKPNNKKLLAHLGDYPKCPSLSEDTAATVVIGPEGGFTDKEVASFIAAGYAPVVLRDRVLKVETAVPVIVSKLYY